MTCRSTAHLGVVAQVGGLGIGHGRDGADLRQDQARLLFLDAGNAQPRVLVQPGRSASRGSEIDGHGGAVEREEGLGRVLAGNLVVQ